MAEDWKNQNSNPAPVNSESQDPIELLTEEDSAPQTILLLKSTTNSLKAAENFLKNRKWIIFTATTIRDAIAILVEKKPQYFFIAADHPNRKVKTLPMLVTSSFPVKLISFAETSTSAAVGALHEMSLEYSLFPPVSGPAIERIVLKMRKDEAQKLRDIENKKAQLSAGNQGFDKPGSTKEGSSGDNFLSGSDLSHAADDAQKALSALLNLENHDPNGPLIFEGQKSSMVGYNPSQDGNTSNTGYNPNQEGKTSDGGNLPSFSGNSAENDYSSSQDGRSTSGGYNPAQLQDSENSPSAWSAAPESAENENPDFNSDKNQSNTGYNPQQGSPSAKGMYNPQQGAKGSQGMYNPQQSALKSGQGLQSKGTKKNPNDTSGPESNPLADTGLQGFMDLYEDPNPNDNIAKQKEKAKPTLRDALSKDSIILKGTQQALEESVRLTQDNSSINKLEIATNLACITIESPRFSGYLVAALGNNRKIDQDFIETVKKRLYAYLKAHGEIPSDEDESMGIKIEEVAFEDWALEQAEFLRKSVHDGNEVAMAFFPTSDTKAKIEDSVSEKMVKMQITELKEDTPVEFDLYIFMPENNKYLLYTPQGRTFFGNQKSRLSQKGITHMHLRKESIGDVKKYRAQNFLNEKIDTYKKNRKS